MAPAHLLIAAALVAGFCLTKSKLVRVAIILLAVVFYFAAQQ